MSMQFWIILGAALLALELLLIDAQFYLVFLGLAAISTGGLLLLGAPLSSPADWLLFGVLALAFTFGFRRRVYAALKTRHGAGLAAPFSSGTAVPSVLIAPGKEGPVQHNGSPWTGRNVGTLPLEPGEPAQLQGRDGLVLLLVRHPT
ncbi:MAG: hypothetical protein RJB26_305 [Pseudomonadota bacterium]|jgi:membrane protein implicated in regulation of membrane protease activity